MQECLVSDLAQVIEGEEALAMSAELHGRPQVGPVEEDPPPAQFLAPLVVALGRVRWLKGQHLRVVWHDFMNKDSQNLRAGVHRDAFAFTLGKLMVFVGNHALASEQVTLAIVATKDIVVLQVQLRIPRESRVLELADTAPCLGLLAAVRHCRADGPRQAAWEQRGQAMQTILHDQTLEHAVAGILHDGLVHVRACREKDQVARRLLIGEAPIQRPE
mmetsp:Transcript_28511/g.66393  ORF Transcript_28511/g.66393 Transcript_28511/m.66393 type:complete len:217 (+) Transcript_28511:479-1129(+)